MLPQKKHPHPAGVSKSLQKQIAPSKNHGEPADKEPFSIRQYALACRRKDIFSNWPFPEKYLQICLNHGISDALPPLESHNAAIQSLRGRAVGLNSTQQGDGNVDYFENNKPNTVEQEVEDHTIDPEIGDHTTRQEVEDHTIDPEIGDHITEQEVEDHTTEQETEDHTTEQETEDHTMEQEIEDEKLYSGMVEAVSELSIQNCHLSPSNSSRNREEIKTDSSPQATSSIVVSTDQPSTTIPTSHLDVVQCNKSLTFRKQRRMKKRHNGKLRKRSMVNILDVAKPCTSEDLLRIKRLCCVSSIPIEEGDEGIEHLIAAKQDCNSDITKDNSSENVERDDCEAADLSMHSTKRLVVKFKFSGCKSNV